jgi:hypothetical protein
MAKTSFIWETDKKARVFVFVKHFLPSLTGFVGLLRSFTSTQVQYL